MITLYLNRKESRSTGWLYWLCNDVLIMFSFWLCVYLLSLFDACVFGRSLTCVCVYERTCISDRNTLNVCSYVLCCWQPRIHQQNFSLALLRARREKIKRKHTCFPYHRMTYCNSIQFLCVWFLLRKIKQTNSQIFSLNHWSVSETNQKMILKPTWWARYECVTFSAIRSLPDKNKRTHTKKLITCCCVVKLGNDSGIW